MNTSMYALTRSERACLQYSIAFLVSALFYGLIADRVVTGMDHQRLTLVMLYFPVLLLTSMCAGFFITTVAAYAIRVSSRSARKGDTL